MRSTGLVTRNAGERLAAVEIRVEQLLEDGLRREEQNDKILDAVKKLTDEVVEVKSQMNRYKGFLGGILWVLVAMGSSLGFLYKWASPLLNMIKGVPQG